MTLRTSHQLRVDAYMAQRDIDQNRIWQELINEIVNADTRSRIEELENAFRELSKEGCAERQNYYDTRMGELKAKIKS